MEEREREEAVSIKDRFESKFFVSPDGCWIWTAQVDYYGYGVFWKDNKRTKAHRFSYELYVGKIANDLVIDHICKQPSCVNPNHLEPVTIKENTLRGSRTKTICEHGNGFTRCELGCRNIYQTNKRNKDLEKTREYQRNYMREYRKRGKVND